MPRYCIAIPTTPPYCDGGAAGRSESPPSAGLIGVTSRSCAWNAPPTRLPLLRGETRPRLLRDNGLPSCLLRLQLSDLRLEPREHPLLLCDLALDRPLLARPLLDDLRL